MQIFNVATYSQDSFHSTHLTTQDNIQTYPGLPAQHIGWLLRVQEQLQQQSEDYHTAQIRQIKLYHYLHLLPQYLFYHQQKPGILQKQFFLLLSTHGNF